MLLNGVFFGVYSLVLSLKVILRGVALVQFIGFGLGISAFVYGLATNQNGQCVAVHGTFCQVLRIALAFDTLLWYSF
jgi:hypothetical protein